jgi:hypothetical protein
MGGASRDVKNRETRSNAHYDQGGGIQIEIAIEIGIEIPCLSSISIPIPISIRAFL